MRTGTAKGKRLGGLAIALTVLLLLTACAPTPESPEEKTVLFGDIEPLTGGGATSA